MNANALTIEAIHSALSRNAITCAIHPLDSNVACTEPDFNSNWYRSHREIGKAWCDRIPSVGAEELISVLRRKVFEQIRQNTGDSLLASWAIDDFEFILRAAYLEVSDPWIIALWETYESGINPHADSESMKRLLVFPQEVLEEKAGIAQSCASIGECRLQGILKYIIPRIPVADLPAVFGFTALGALIAGCYGILHDQVTFTIGPEYFRNFKFHQFAYADFGFGDRIFVSTIGFLATWWVGLIVGWILSRRCLPNQPRTEARQQILLGFAIVFATAFLAGVIGYFYGLWLGPSADYSGWQSALNRYDVSDTWSFMRVGYIHNAGYIGGLLGLVCTFFFIKPDHASSDSST